MSPSRARPPYLALTPRFSEKLLTNGMPLMTLGMSDAVEETVGCFPFATQTQQTIFGNAGHAAKISVPPGMTFTVVGIDINPLRKIGTPAGDLRVRIFDSADALVTNASVTVDKDHLLTTTTDVVFILVPVTWSLHLRRMASMTSYSMNGNARTMQLAWTYI